MFHPLGTRVVFMSISCCRAAKWCCVAAAVLICVHLLSIFVGVLRLCFQALSVQRSPLI